MSYDFKSIEKKWQDFWEQNKTFQTPTSSNKPKKYILDMFPYPSGTGLHIGHPKGYTGTDIAARYYNAKGYNVLHPMGFDAFGLPAENFALKTGIHPAKITQENIATFITQLKSLGFGYDWDRMVDTTDPKYYQWTQWIFLKLFENGLAYEQDLPINYCPSCKTGLANEEVLSDFSCERCGTKVEKKKIRQWVLAITKYAERLLSDLDDLDWPESLKEMQRNWIGKSEGCKFRMKLYCHPELDSGSQKIDSGSSPEGQQTPSISAYTTRIDTVFGMTYAVMAPDHKDVFDFITPEQKEICEKYIENAAKKSDQDRTQEDKEKTGVFTGSYVINPFNNEKVPLWIGDYVLGNYGTGAVMAVPAHDERDFAFAKKYDLEIRQSIAPYKIMTGINAPQKGKKEVEKNYINAIIEFDGEFLLLEEKVGCKFVGGGIESGESPEEGIKREIMEETGFTDFSIEGQILNSGYFGYAYRNHKDINQKGFDYPFFHIKLNSLKQEEISQEEQDTHSLKWVDKKEVKDLLFSDGHKYPWDCFCNEKAFTEYGKLVDSGVFSGLNSEEAKIAMTEFAEKNGFGSKKINYKLRDWLFSRQRYWGEPIPLIHLENETIKKLPQFDEEAFEKIINKKMRSAPLQVEWGVPMDTTANSSLSNSILENIKKVKKKRKKRFYLKEYLSVKTVGDKQIQVSGQYLVEHFRKKSDTEFFKRIQFSSVIIENLESTFFLNDTFGLINLHNRFWVIILEKNKSNSYNLVTFYEFYELNKLLSKKAYKLDDTYLLINGEKQKMYDGIYGKIICDYSLPLELPQIDDYKPAGDGNSPLAKVDDFVNVQLAENLSGKRETNTMPQWGGSCWYYLRYLDPENQENFASQEALDYWQNVDEYIGGTEHAVLHLLYARFWHKFLYDIGAVPTKEPFQKLINQGMVLTYAYQTSKGQLIPNDLVEEKGEKFFHIETGEELKQIVAKMSKSLKNTLNPMDFIEEYGADTLRLYEMSIGDFRDSAPWQSEAIVGMYRFLEKVYAMFIDGKNPAKDDMKAMKLLHKTIKKVEEDIVDYKFNTAITALIILVNEGMPQESEFQEEWKESFLTLLHPFAPHIAEELWSKMDKNSSIFVQKWPEYDEFMLVDDEVTIAVQINGKMRGTFTFLNGVAQEEVSEVVRADEKIQKWIGDKEVFKEIFIPNKMLSLVVK